MQLLPIKGDCQCMIVSYRTNSGAADLTPTYAKLFWTTPACLHREGEYVIKRPSSKHCGDHTKGATPKDRRILGGQTPWRSHPVEITPKSGYTLYDHGRCQCCPGLLTVPQGTRLSEHYPFL